MTFKRLSLGAEEPRVRETTFLLISDGRQRFVKVGWAAAGAAAGLLMDCWTLREPPSNYKPLHSYSSYSEPLTVQLG